MKRKKDDKLSQSLFRILQIIYKIKITKVGGFGRPSLYLKNNFLKIKYRADHIRFPSVIGLFFFVVEEFLSEEKGGFSLAYLL